MSTRRGLMVSLSVIGCFAFGMVQLVVALLPAEGSAWNTPRWLPAIAVVAVGFGAATLVQWAWWTTFNQVRLPTRRFCDHIGKIQFPTATDVDQQ